MYILVLYLIGIILCMLLNLLVIVVSLSKKSKINHLDLCIISLAVSDFLQAGMGYSLEIHGFINVEVVNTISCGVAGFPVTFFALVSITHLVGISLERFVIMKFPIQARMWSKQSKVSLYIIIPSWLYGLGCALPPLLGWSSYRRLKKGDYLCQVDLNSGKAEAYSYLWFLISTCFIVPMIIISISSALILVEAKNITKEVSALGLRGRHAARRRLDERKHAYMVVVIIVTYVISWSPYATCVFVFSSKGTVSDNLLNFSAIFAKISAIYNPIIYSLFVTPFRKQCLQFFGCRTSLQESFLFSNNLTQKTISHSTLRHLNQSHNKVYFFDKSKNKVNTIENNVLAINIIARRNSQSLTPVESDEIDYGRSTGNLGQSSPIGFSNAALEYDEVEKQYIRYVIHN